MSLPVHTTPEADAQIRSNDDWWRAHRSAAPNLFADELATSFEIISNTPNIGRLYRQSPVPATRRVLLKETRYHVYYLLRVDRIDVLAVWHGKRGAGPPLRAAHEDLGV